MPEALLSLSNKTGSIDFARALADLGWTLIASGGTARAIRDAGLAVTEVAAVTGAPEMLGGRVKTLHPVIHAGILAGKNQADLAELASHGIQSIDLVACNLYPFQQTVARPDVSLDVAVETIDIGGVTLLRAAAKNHERVLVICDPDDYDPVVEELRAGGTASLETRQRLAIKAFAHTRDYDTAIESYLRQRLSSPDLTDLSSTLDLSLQLVQNMRYGENPHQAAGLYAEAGVGPLGGKLLQGKPLSYNNMLDLDAAWRAVGSFDAPTIVIVKHLSPCGIACAEKLSEAFRAALASDPISAFGGVIASNRVVNEETAEAMHDLFVEAIAAPDFSHGAADYLARHKPNCRLVGIPDRIDDVWEMRSVTGGVLFQSPDQGDPASAEWRTVTERRPSEREMAALGLAWTACQHVKSNAIVLARDGATVGIGGGVPSRVDAVKLAIAKAGERASGAVMASDAFIPFPDGVEVAGEAGVTAVVQPGGSVRDEAVTAAANRLGMAMVFTGVRHFRH